MDTNIRICGEAGQGVQTIGNLIANVMRDIGMHVFATQSYMSRIRGGRNAYDIRISDREIFSPKENADLLVALSAEALEFYRPALAPGGVILFDGAEDDETVVSLDMAAAAKQAGGTAQMSNSVAAGAIFALLGLKKEKLINKLKRTFSHKSPEVAELNATCAMIGVQKIAMRSGSVSSPKGADKPVGELADGSGTVALSAMSAGVKVVSCYPMTPSTGIFTALAGMADMYGAVVEQAEDEIAAINMVCGAAYAGVPAMTATSGGGFALMVEGLSLAGMMELPAVIVLSQRPGPATGLPTRTGQEDLLFAVNAGHGEFARSVFAPGTIPQAYSLTRRALEIAHTYQSPSIIMFDQFIADMQKTAQPLPVSDNYIDRCIVKDAPREYQRYAITEDGISPRAIPGGEAFVVADSDEHTPDGHLTEDLEVREAMQRKRMRKEAALLARSLAPEYHPRVENEILLCWGSTYGPCREAVDILRESGREICMVHFSQVWPLDGEKLAGLFAGRRVIAVEGNARGQFAALLRQCGALGEFELISRIDGLPFTAEYIVRKVK